LRLCGLFWRLRLLWLGVDYFLLFDFLILWFIYITTLVFRCLLPCLCGQFRLTITSEHLPLLPLDLGTSLLHPLLLLTLIVFLLILLLTSLKHHHPPTLFTRCDHKLAHALWLGLLKYTWRIDIRYTIKLHFPGILTYIIPQSLP
jgi:hypothetical protein